MHRYKPIVSAAALALTERQELGLDDPVTRWIAEFRPKLSDGTEPRITIRELLTHTAGLTYGFFEPENGPYHKAQVSDGLDQPGVSIAENLKRIASVPLAYKPGTAWGYSVATDVLGEVVARACGCSLPEAVRRFITAPLGITDTGFKVSDRSRLAVPYADANPAPVRMSDAYIVKFGTGAGIRFSPSRVLDRRSFLSGGAGMVGTADDFLKFLEALRMSGTPILKPETVQKMTTNQIGALSMPDQGLGRGFGFGFAVITDPRLANTPQSNGTFTWGGAYGHSWFVDPARRLSVVALTNTAVEGMSGAFPTELRNAVYGASADSTGSH